MADALEVMTRAIERGVSYVDVFAVFVPGLGVDRISGMFRNIMKAQFIAYTQRICTERGIATEVITVRNAAWQPSAGRWSDARVALPRSPVTGGGVLLIPGALPAGYPAAGDRQRVLGLGRSGTHGLSGGDGRAVLVKEFADEATFLVLADRPKLSDPRRSVASNMTYTAEQRRCASAWKKRTSSLPDEAREPAHYIGKGGRPRGGPYPFCLPEDFAPLNLLPEVRTGALAIFDELGIPWHAGVAGGPSNHLLSQVQCVNALGQMVHEPDRIAVAFAGVGQVEEIEPGRYLTFEYIGPTDFFGEAPDGERVRGAHCTSVDAAFVHRAPDGRRELVLVEWKYTESYADPHTDTYRDATRRRRYAAALADPAGPVRDGVLAFEHLVDEPFYQLMRQQLLAHALEQAGVADRVRVVHVLSPANTDYQQSLPRAEHRAAGASVSGVWQRLLRRPDRFTTMDPAVFLDPQVTSPEYVLRYAPDVVWNEAGLLRTLAVADADAVEDALDWDGDVELDEQGVWLRVGTEATGMAYPFRLTELLQLAAELES